MDTAAGEASGIAAVSRDAAALGFLGRPFNALNEVTP